MTPIAYGWMAACAVLLVAWLIAVAADLILLSKIEEHMARLADIEEERFERSQEKYDA